MEENRYLEQIATHKGSFVLYLILRAAVAVVLVIQIRERDWQNVFLCLAVLILFLLPSFAETKFHVRLPAMMQNIILLFIFCAEILGEVGAFYERFPWWDTMLHTINGFIVAIIGFSLVSLLNESEKIVFRLSPLFTVIVAFCFSMTVGVCWEFGEYAMDRMFGLDMQKDTVIHEIASVSLNPTGGNRPVTIDGITEVTVNGQGLGLGGYLDIGLYDTMNDLWVNFVGAAVFCVIGYRCLKSEEKRDFLENLMVKSEGKDPDGQRRNHHENIFKSSSRGIDCSAGYLWNQKVRDKQGVNNNASKAKGENSKWQNQSW